MGKREEKRCGLLERWISSNLDAIIPYFGEIYKNGNMYIITDETEDEWERNLSVHTDRTGIVKYIHDIIHDKAIEKMN